MIIIFNTVESGTICLLFFLQVLILEKKKVVILPNKGTTVAFPSLKQPQENNSGSRLNTKEKEKKKRHLQHSCSQHL